MIMSFHFSLILLSILFSLSIAISIGNAPLNVNALSVRSMVNAAAPAPAPAVNAAAPISAASAVKIESNSNSNSTVAKHAGMQTKGLTLGFKENPPFFALKGPYGPLKVRGNELVLSLTEAPGLDSFFEWVNGYQLRLVGTNSCLDSNSGTQVYLNPQCGANINDNPHQNFIVVEADQVSRHIQWRGDIRRPLIRSSTSIDRCFHVDGRTDGAKLTMRDCSWQADGQNFDLPAAPIFRIKETQTLASYIKVDSPSNGKALQWGSIFEDPVPEINFKGMFEWYYNQQLRLFGTNYCLDNNGKTENGSPVYIWNCSPDNANQFFAVVNGRQIQKKGTDKCLDFTRSNNGQFILWTCSDELPYQKFQIPAPPVFKILVRRLWPLTATNGLYNGAPLKAMEANGPVRGVDPGPNQLFEWVNGQQLRVVGSNFCLDTNYGATLYLWSCSSTNSNQFFIQRAGMQGLPGSAIQWKNSNKCIIHGNNGDMMMEDCDTAIRRDDSPVFSYPYYPFQSFNY